MLRVRFDIDPMLVRLASIFSILTDPDILLRPAASVVAQAIERNFIEEGRPEPWLPLSVDYALWKSIEFPGTRILERTGALRNSIVTEIERGVGDTASIVASTSVPYAAQHQFGNEFFPRRPFLVLTEGDREEMAQAVLDVLEGTGSNQ